MRHSSRWIMLGALLFATVFLLSVAAAPSPAAANPPPRTVFVHLFEWKWTDIEQECVNFLGPKGFAAVQVSPPNEHIDHTQVNDYAWWARYQPVTYQLESRSGTRQQFINMVNTCKTHGVDIYVDAVINHMADQVGVGVAGSTFNRPALSYPTYSNLDFNSCSPPNIQGSDYNNNAWRVRHCQLSGLPDLDQGSSYVRGQIQAYLQDLVDIGVAGFRVDAAKHMEVADINAIFAGVTGNYYVFLEVIDPGGQSISSSEYTPYHDVTEFKYSQKIGETFATGQLSWLSNFGEPWGFVGTTSAVVFVDNHDNQRGHGMAAQVTHRSGTLYDLANIYMLAWPYGYPKVMSSYEWGGVNDSQGPPHDGSGSTKSVYNGNGSLNCFGNDWKCEHRWQPIANMVAFRNHAAAAGAYTVTNWWDNGGNQIAFTRSGASGGAGFVVINREGYGLNQSFQTGLPAGTYCNIISGDFNEAAGTCSGSTISVDGSGWANISLNGMSAAAIHIGAVTGPGSSCSGQMYLRGTFNGWGTEAMNLVDSGVCTWEEQITFSGSSSDRFKFDVFGDWSTNYGDSNGDGFVDLFGGDIYITQGAGTYTVQYTESSGAYVVTLNGPTNNSATVTFTVNGYVTQPGQAMYVVGSTPELGNWNTANAVPLTWQDSDTWSGPVLFTSSAGQSIEYKFIVKQGSSVIWQSGGNHTYSVPASGTGSTSANW
ncbi:MAG: carbohydrate-binding module family 20 domain-containing protein [Ardenticatenaceae bacterium]|nr:carbohydrate-binding module family 20 domain-containing protein [Ardenticatenaceae bacterium]